MATRTDIETHYDAHNRVFLRILDHDYLAYSTGHWAGAQDMRSAQTAKFDYIARQIGLAERTHVLEIGSGWGSFAKYCHEAYPHVRLVGLTLSAEQKTYVDAQGWSNFECFLSDWRDFASPEPFDAIVAIESLEHFASMEDRRRHRHVEVYRSFFTRCALLSSQEAPLYVQSSIVRSDPTDFQGFKDARFILNKVFPGSALATISSLQAASHEIYEFEELRLRGQDMIRTLEVWRSNLMDQGDSIRSDFGEEMVDFFATYFDASLRRFEKGHVDLLEVTLRKARLL